MRAIASFRPDRLEVAWGVFAVANFLAMLHWPGWETIPFHFIWISLTLLYGFRVWGRHATAAVLGVVLLATGGAIMGDAFAGVQLWGELFEVPLMSAMFLAMVWHARRRQDALRTTELQAEQLASLLERQQRFLHDVSHELRTPVTIARGHLEVFQRTEGNRSPELNVALDELGRIEGIVERLLLLAKAEHPDFFVVGEIELAPFMEDVFMRWSEVAPRAWHLGELTPGILVADAEHVRIALDALLENAVKYTDSGDRIELRSTSAVNGVVIEVADEGCGIGPHVVGHIFERFARADTARTRSTGGVGLGLSIVAAIVRGHSGHCTIETSESGSTFALHLPRFVPAAVAVGSQPLLRVSSASS
jgi:signal transduction histidine kinase